MSLYDELAEKGIGYSKKYFEYQQECQLLTRKFAIGYASYLGANKEHLSYIELNEHLEKTGKTKPLIGHPKITRGKDCFFYFGINLLLKNDSEFYMQQNTIFGISKTNSEVKIKWNESVFEEPLSNPNFVKLYEKLFSEAMSFYESEILQTKNSIGFSPMR